MSDNKQISPNEALQRLKEGNERYCRGETNAKTGSDRRKDLTNGQHPFAAILGCADSRVPPEHIFDQGLGDIFTVRVAGNVVDETVLGSIEYGAEHLHTPLILVLGHKSCGAVKATLAGGEPEGNIGKIVEKISPAVKTAKEKTNSEHEQLDIAIMENTKNTAKKLTEKSEILNRLVEKGEVEIKIGIYDLETGKVDFL